MGVDAIYKQQDDGIPYRALSKELEAQLIENKKNG